MTSLNQSDNYCPDCGLSLIPAKDVSRNLRIDHRVLQAILIMTVIVLLVLVYFYYIVSY